MQSEIAIGSGIPGCSHPKFGAISVLSYVTVQYLTYQANF